MIRLTVNKDALLIASRSFEELPLVIGSGETCHLTLEDADLPTRAAVIRGEEGRVLIEPLPGVRGVRLGETSIDGIRPLKAGDTITLGRYTLVVEETGAAARSSPGPPRASDGEKALQELFRLVDQFESLVQLDRILAKMLVHLVSVFGADRGAIYVRESPEAELVAVAIHPEDLGPQGIRPSRTVLKKVLAEGCPVLATDVPELADAEGIESIDAALNTIICAPLTARDGPSGVVYLDSRSQRDKFGKKDLRLLNTVARYFSSAVKSVGVKEKLGRDLDRMRTLHREQLAAQRDPTRIIGSGPAMVSIFQQLENLAPEDVTALITGESGTGKELLAQAIHTRSHRSGGPFVAINCMALPRDLVESELFGHEKGAFSGAHEKRVGRFELAHGGTLFLDEIGELSHDVQVKLLRVLQERRFERVGGRRSLPLDVRLVCATNVDLHEAVQQGRFRSDLFYRIAVYVLHMPPLRERPEDIPALVKYFIEENNRRMRKKIRGITKEALDSLCRHRWPGNVRELRNVIEQSFIRAVGDEITPASLNLPGTTTAGLGQEVNASSDTFDHRLYTPHLETAKKEFEARFLEAHLQLHGGNVSETATALGTSRVNLHKKIKEYELKKTA